MDRKLTTEEVAESFKAVLASSNIISISIKRRFDWGRLASWLALPFVAAAMVIVPLFGGHLCPEEVIPMLAGAASIPFIGPTARALIARLRKQQPAKVHCCDENHKVARKDAKPLPDIDLDHTWFSPIYERDNFKCNECGHSYTDLSVRDLHACPECEWNHADQSKFEVSLNAPRPRVVYSNKVKKEQSKCTFPGCSFIGSGAGHSHVPESILPPTCSDGHLGCHGDDALAYTYRVCDCPNVLGLHRERISCPPKEG